MSSKDNISVFEKINIDKIVNELREIANRATNEEEFKIHTERVMFNEVISKLGLDKYTARYEYTFVTGGRADALYGHVIIEYKAPPLSGTVLSRAKEQIIKYIKKEAKVEERYKDFLGIILSDKIVFVRWNAKERIWEFRGPYEINRDTILRIIEAIRGLRRKRLDADFLAIDFGVNPKTNKASPIASKVVKTLYKKLIMCKDPKVLALFEDWKRIFSQVVAYDPKKLKGLEEVYGISGKKIDYSALLFSIHTYYAFLMKLLAAELTYLHGVGAFFTSYIAELFDAHHRGINVFRKKLEEIESGGLFKKILGITNFIEGGYFSWYLDVLDEELAKTLIDVIKTLDNYEPTTPILEPEFTKDLLKRLYQYLVPKNIRHDIGEYYTPDWLAELLLDEVGLTVDNFEKLRTQINDSLAPLKLRILDPACGSGTFLILIIKRLKEYAENHYLLDELPKYLLKNVVGIDLNPLAVLAARTNYLISIIDLLRYIPGEKEIPIYLADSLMVEKRVTLTSRAYVVRTIVGEFQIPASIVENKLLGKLLSLVEEKVMLRYNPEEFTEVVKREIPNLNPYDLIMVKDLYKNILELEEKGKDHIWTSIIKNAFAPLFIGRFDYIVGNPPWILWDSLPEDYRKISMKLWQDYNLLIKKDFERSSCSTWCN